MNNADSAREGPERSKNKGKKRQRPETGVAEDQLESGEGGSDESPANILRLATAGATSPLTSDKESLAGQGCTLSGVANCGDVLGRFASTRARTSQTCRRDEPALQVFRAILLLNVQYACLHSE